MPIRFHCPECSKPLAIGSRKAGTHITCPVCKGAVTVPPASNYFKRSPLEIDDNVAGSLCLGPMPLPEVGPGGPDRGLVLRTPPPLPAPEEAVPQAITASVPAEPNFTLPLTGLAATSPRPLPVDDVPDVSAGGAEGSSWRDLLPGAALVATVVVLLVIPAVISLLGLFAEQEAPPREPPQPVLAEAFLPPAPAVLPLPTPPATQPELAKPPAPAAVPGAELPPASPAPAPAVKPPVVQEPLPEKPAPPPAPAPTPVAETAPKKAGSTWAEKWARKRRSEASDEDLRKQLVMVPQVGLDTVPNSTAMLLAAARSDRGRTGTDLAPLLMARRPDLAGLPVHMGADCRLGKEHAENLQALSRKLRTHLEASIPGAGSRGTIADPRPDPNTLRDRLLGDAEKGAWLQPEAIPTLLQLLMAENKNVRMILVDLLARIPGRQATEALAARALYDLYPQVREAAVAALKDRPAREYEPALLRGFQYPWNPVADHAAEALVLLEDRDAVPKLVMLLETKDVSRPFIMPINNRKVAVVQELVRVNHLGNCLLCHAPSFVQTDLVRGRVPLPGQALPAPVTTAQYYEGNQGIFVHADTTYVRQDFSVCQPVPNPGPWPSYQRNDYLVRLRPLTGPELMAWRQNVKRMPRITPRQESLIYALRELTGKDLGPLPDNWKNLLAIAGPRPAGDSSAALDAGTAPERPGGAPDLKESTRQAFAQFLAQLPVPDLRDKLKDKNKDLRHAAVLACGLRDAKALVPDLMERLRDTEPAIAIEAARILKQIDPQLPLKGEAQDLSAALADAAPERQEQLVAAYQAGDGHTYDLALARAIPRLPPPTRSKARAALAGRLTKAPIPDVRDGLHDADREIRFAAVEASGQKKVWSLVPDLIPLLSDEDAQVIQRARQVLRQITGQDMGPEAGAAVYDRLRAVTAWQAWWKRQARQ